MKKLFAFGILLFVFSAATIAQVSETASASATIVTPIAITKVTAQQQAALHYQLLSGQLQLHHLQLPERRISLTQLLFLQVQQPSPREGTV